MKYPLDTEVWLWMQAHPDRIGHHTLSLITDEQNELLVSAANGCEIARKLRRGRRDGEIHAGTHQLLATANITAGPRR